MGLSSDLITTWFERVWNNGDASYIDEGLCESCELTGLAADTIRSRADFHQFHGMLNSTFDGIKVTADHLLDDGDTFAGVVSVAARHRTTGKPVHFKSSFFGTVSDGKIHKVTNLVEYLPMLIQLDALPADVLERGLVGES